MTQRIHIAVAGAGVIGQAHIKRILEEPQAELAAIIDPSPKANEQAQALGVPAFADLEEGLQASKPNGVVIATPNQLHVPNGLTAVAAGVPMLLEKPVSGDVESAMQLVEAAERAAVAILVGHHRRHSPLIQRAREIVESGRLGKLTAVTGLSLFLKPKDYFDGSGAWRREPGGGVVLINLIHVIDDLRNICGDIVAIQAAQSSTARGFPVEDTTAMILHFANGALGTLAISDAANAPWSWELTSGENKAYPQTDQFCYLVAGTGGSLTVPRLDVWSHEGDGWWTPMEAERRIVPEQDPLTVQMRHFCQVIRGGPSRSWMAEAARARSRPRSPSKRPRRQARSCACPDRVVRDGQVSQITLPSTPLRLRVGLSPRLEMAVKRAGRSPDLPMGPSLKTAPIRRFLVC